MKRLLFAFFPTLLLFSCGEKNTAAVKENVIVEKIQAEIPPEDNFDYDTLQGMYMGKFGGSDIRIILNYVSGTNAIGYNIHKGLQRNLTGKVTRSGDSVQIVLAEPGDHEYDGVFTLDFIGDDHEPNGTWVSNSGKISEKSFQLNKLVAPEKMDYENISIHNFSNIFGMVSDTIGDYQFEKDGLVILSYYEKNNEDRYSEQMKQLKGSWTLEGDYVTINWEDNDIFPDNTLKLVAVRHEYGEWSLKGNGDHELWMMYP